MIVKCRSFRPDRPVPQALSDTVKTKGRSVGYPFTECRYLVIKRSFIHYCYYYCEYVGKCRKFYVCMIKFFDIIQRLICVQEREIFLVLISLYVISVIQGIRMWWSLSISTIGKSETKDIWYKKCTHLHIKER